MSHPIYSDPNSLQQHNNTSNGNNSQQQHMQQQMNVIQQHLAMQQHPVMGQHGGVQQQQQMQQHGGIQQHVTMPQQSGMQVLHVRGDSNSELEALFSVLNNNNVDKPPTNSFKNRNLPPSFFRPPDPKHGTGDTIHSRDGSLDCTLSNVPLSVPGTGSALKTVHSRSASSPAQFSPHTPMTLLSQQQQQQASATGGGAMMSIKHELDVDSKAAVQRMQQQQPNGGGGGTGGIHNMNTDVWQQQQAELLKRQFQQQQSQQVKNKQQQSTGVRIQGGPPGPLAPHGVISQDLGPLPDGWEQGVTPEGEVYFINHYEKTTSWFDPRITERVHKTNLHEAASAGQKHKHQQTRSQPVVQQQQQQQQQLHQRSNSGQLLLLPQQQQQQQQQQQSMFSEQYIHAELRKLHQENDRLKREMDRVAQQELLLTQLLNQSSPAGHHMGGGTAQGGGGGGVMLGGPKGNGVIGVDAFLGGQVNVKQELIHGRQNSGDSGLGGMNLNYTLPRTPDDFLCNVDEMDLADGGPKHKLTQQMMGGVGGGLMMGDMMGMHGGGGGGRDLTGTVMQGVMTGPHSSTDLQMDVADGKNETNIYGDENIVSSLSEGVIGMELLNDAQKIDDGMLWL